MSEAGVIIREYVPGDWRFVSDAWGHSWLKQRTYPMRAVPFDRIKDRGSLHRLLVELVSRSHVLVAALADDPNVLFGFVAGEQGTEDDAVLHFLYVKRSARRQGLGTLLVDRLAERTGTLRYHSFETFEYKGVAQQKDESGERIRFRGFQQRLGTRFSPGHAMFPIPEVFHGE